MPLLITFALQNIKSTPLNKNFRAKEETVENESLPEAPEATVQVTKIVAALLWVFVAIHVIMYVLRKLKGETPNLQVNQPVPVAASVSQEIAAQLNQAKVEEEKEDYQSEKEVESDGVSLDQDSNQSVHLSGENIALDDDCDEEVDELEAEDEKEEGGDVVVKHDAVVGVKGELDTAAKITSLLSELTSESESREVIQSR